MARHTAAALVEVDEALSDLREAASAPATPETVARLRHLALEVVDRCDRAAMLTALDAFADTDDDFARFMAGDDERHLVEFA